MPRFSNRDMQNITIGDYLSIIYLSTHHLSSIYHLSIHPSDESYLSRKPQLIYMKIFTIRNLFMRLWRLTNPKICSYLARDPREPMCTSNLSPKTWELMVQIPFWKPAGWMFQKNLKAGNHQCPSSLIRVGGVTQPFALFKSSIDW